MTGKICLVEDTPDILENLTQFLGLEGFDVLPCRNGHEAIETLERDLPDLIITDLWMPEMNGFALIDIISKRQTWNAIPIAVFTAVSLTDNDKELLTNKVVGYMSKPITMDCLIQSIQKYLKK